MILPDKEKEKERKRERERERERVKYLNKLTFILMIF